MPNFFRRFLGHRSLCLVVFAAAAVSPGAVALPALDSAGAEAGPRPNIVFLVTDDQRDNSLGAMGHPFVQTPHLDALMAESVRFRNAYIATPVCAPSRVSFFTGLPERVHGVGFSSSYDLTRDQWSRSYPALLREAGYHTGFIGKFGVEYYEFRGRAADKFDYWWGHDGWTRFLPKDHDTPSTRPYHDAEQNVISFIMGEAMAGFLEQLPADQPFCLSVSFNVPHGSQTTSMDPGHPGSRAMSRPANTNPALRGLPFYDTLYRDIDIPIPADTGTDPHRLIPRSVMDQDKGRNTTYQYSYDRDSCREHHIRYYQTITGLDHVIGGFLDQLDRLGLADNTIVIFTSDHGLIMGEYGMGGKELLLDLAMKIPAIVHDPRLPPAMRGRQLDQLVSSLDFTATILDYAGVRTPEFAEGQSLRPLIEGEGAATDWRDELFLESLFTLRDNPFQEGLRTERWKYIRFYRGVLNFVEQDVDFRGREPDHELLFDLANDPQERHDLAGDPDHAGILAELRDRTARRSELANQRRDDYREFTPPLPRDR